MKTKQKTNKSARIAAILMVLVMITTCALTGTLAKYTTAASAKSQNIRVAAWDIEIYDAAAKSGAGDWVALKDYEGLALLGTNFITNAEDATQENATGNQWEEDEDSYEYNSYYGSLADYKDTTNTTGVDFLVFPGVGGYQNIKLRNRSEVPATLSINTGTADVATDLTVISLAVTDDEAIDIAGSGDVDFADLDWTGDLYMGLPASTTVELPAWDGTGGGPDAYTLGIAWKWDFSPLDTPAGLGEDDEGDTLLGVTAATPADAITAALEGAQIIVSQID